MFRNSESIHSRKAPLVAVVLATALLLAAVPCSAAGPGMPGRAPSTDTAPTPSWSLDLSHSLHGLVTWVTAAWTEIRSDADPDGSPQSAASTSPVAPAAVGLSTGAFGLRELRSRRLAD